MRVQSSLTAPSFFMFKTPLGRNARRWGCANGSYGNIAQGIARESCGAFVDKYIMPSIR